MRAVAGLAALAVLAGAGVARGQGAGEAPSSVECCLPLLLPVGAHGFALGNALAARSAVDGVFINPAGLAGLDGDQLVVHSATSFATRITGVSVLFARPAIGTLGITYRLMDMGETEVRDDFGNLLGTLLLRDHALVASFAADVAPGLSAGLNYLLYHSSAGCSGNCGPDEGGATTHGVDLGLQYAPGPIPALRVGASLLNLGFPLQVINSEQADRLPTRLRIGAAYDVLTHVRADSTLALWVSADVSRTLGTLPARTVPSLGLELSFRDAMFVRAGYVRDEGIEGWTAIGIGLEYERFTVAVARPFGQGALADGGDPFQVSFGVKF